MRVSLRVLARTAVDTTSRDTDVFLSQLLPPGIYYRLNPPHIGEVQLDETDKLQLESARCSFGLELIPRHYSLLVPCTEFFLPYRGWDRS
jgi:hypothetical protein|eukprot:SAG25_NODE_91_length_16078_cov_7.663058_12_plen_90_part_00